MARELDALTIPDHWEYDLLDKFGVRCSGHTPSKSHPEYWDEGVKWVSLSDSHRLDKGYIYDTDKKISQAGLMNSSAELHPAETVILSRDAGIGKSGVMAEPMAVSQHFIAWKCDNEKQLNSWFLYNWLQLHKAEFERQAVGSTIKTIGLPYFKKLKIAAPPYSEQKKIAQILSTWDQAITTTEQLLANSQQQKKALMQQLLSGKKRLLDKDGVRFSGEFQTHQLGTVAKVIGGNAFKSTEYKNIGIPLIRISNIKQNYSINMDSSIFLTEDHKLHRFKVKRGDILIAMSGATTGKVGIYSLDTFSYLNQRVGKFEPKIEKISTRYLFQLLKQPRLQFNILIDAVGGAQPNISNKDIERIKLTLPNTEEQQKIATVLTNADQEITTLQQKLDALKQEKKALMQQLLTGKRRVKVEEAV